MLRGAVKIIAALDVNGLTQQRDSRNTQGREMVKMRNTKVMFLGDCSKK